MKVIYIKSNPKRREESYTFQISDYFIEKYKERNPDHIIETLDLYSESEDIHFLTRDDIFELKNGGSEVASKYATQFKSANKIVIAAPMWNFSIPAILKAYIDYIVINGVTFDYTEEGIPIGLMNENTKLLHITARGGSYSNPPTNEMEMGDRYIRLIMQFIGIKNIDTIAIENTSDKSNINKTLEQARMQADELLESNW